MYILVTQYPMPTIPIVFIKVIRVIIGIQLMSFTMVVILLKQKKDCLNKQSYRHIEYNNVNHSFENIIVYNNVNVYMIFVVNLQVLS